MVSNVGVAYCMGVVSDVGVASDVEVSTARSQSTAAERPTSLSTHGAPQRYVTASPQCQRNVTTEVRQRVLMCCDGSVTCVTGL